MKALPPQLIPTLQHKARDFTMSSSSSDELHTVSTAVALWPCYHVLSNFPAFQLLSVTFTCKVGIIRRPISQGQYWNIAQTEGKSLTLYPAHSGWCFFCRPEASAIMPPPPPAQFFNQGHSFLSPELHPVWEGLFFPFVKVTLDSHHYLSKC